MTLMTLVPYQAGTGFSFAETGAAEQAEEPTDVMPAENADAEDKASPEDKEDPAEAESQSSKDSETEDAASAIGFEGKDFDVTLEASPEAGLPDDTELSVEEITSKDKEYKEYYKRALETVQADVKRDSTRTVRFVRLYDMTLTSGDDVLEPDAAVDVTFDYSKAVEAGKAEYVDDPDGIQIIHFTEGSFGREKAELLDKDSVGASIEESALTEASLVP